MFDPETFDQYRTNSDPFLTKNSVFIKSYVFKKILNQFLIVTQLNVAKNNVSGNVLFGALLTSSSRGQCKLPANLAFFYLFFFVIYFHHHFPCGDSLLRIQVNYSRGRSIFYPASSFIYFHFAALLII